MTIVIQSLSWSADIVCNCPNDITIVVKDSAFLDPVGKYLPARIVNVTGAADIAAGTAFDIQYDDALLAAPSAGIQACDIDQICCVDCTEAYLKVLIEALEARVAALEV